MKATLLQRIAERHVLFAVQIALSIGVSVFCMIEASKDDNSKVYVPVLTGIVGYWLPAPRGSNLTMVDAEEHFKNLGNATREIAAREQDLLAKLVGALAEKERLEEVCEKLQDMDSAYDDIERGFAGRVKKL